MEKKAPNLMKNLNNNGLNPKIKSVLVFKCLILLTFVLNFMPLHAQSAGNLQVLEVSSYLTSLKQSEQKSKSSNLQSIHLEQLLNDVQPATYVNSQEVKTYGENPNSLFIDVNSLSNVNNASINKNNIEIIFIKINTTSELNAFVDLSIFSNFTNLKYLCFDSNINVSSQDIAKMIKSNSDQYSIFYQIIGG